MAKVINISYTTLNFYPVLETCHRSGFFFFFFASCISVINYKHYFMLMHSGLFDQSGFSHFILSSSRLLLFIIIVITIIIN